MKLDIDYLEQILNAVETHPQSQISQNDLLAAIDADKSNSDDEDKFYYHMKRIEEAGFLTSPHGSNGNDGFGFNYSMPEGRSLFNTSYELTWDGHRYLEALQSDTISAKAKEMFAQMSIDQFKQKFPALILTLITMGSG